MNITDYIKSKSRLEVFPEPTNDLYKMFNTGGVECEVGEFLYSLVRLMKPKNILETGTHYGISSTYMALGLKNNNGGKLTTIDFCYYEQAKTLHETLEVLEYITHVNDSFQNFNTTNKFELVLLDTEPQLRFDEFVKIFDWVVDGGIIVIHDLGGHLSYNTNHPVSKHWPFGDFTTTLGPYIKSHKVQVFSFNSPRGITLFQKCSKNMSYFNFLCGSLE